jgi:hypothetical protein
LHDTIETKGMPKEDVPALKERVKRAIEGPVEEALKSAAETNSVSAAV